MKFGNATEAWSAQTIHLVAAGRGRGNATLTVVGFMLLAGLVSWFMGFSILACIVWMAIASVAATPFAWLILARARRREIAARHRAEVERRAMIDAERARQMAEAKARGHFDQFGGRDPGD